MAGKEQYQQGALNFEGKQAPVANPGVQPAIEKPNTQFHTLTPASRRLPDDLIPEYLFELQTRERLNLPSVSLDEFEDMRDFSDGITVYGDIDWTEQRPWYPARMRTPKAGTDEQSPSHKSAK